MSARADLAGRIADVAHLTGSFRLRSGVTASEYFDKYQFEARPDLLAQIATELAVLVPPETDVLAGLELGGVPVAVALSLHTGIPAAFVRKKAKDYGTCRLAEGADVAGRKVLVVEDVLTSGGQAVLSTRDLRELGAVVDPAVCVIDREAGAAKALKAADVEMRALFTRSDLP